MVIRVIHPPIHPPRLSEYVAWCRLTDRSMPYGYEPLPIDVVHYLADVAGCEAPRWPRLPLLDRAILAERSGQPQRAEE